MTRIVMYHKTGRLAGLHQIQGVLETLSIYPPLLADEAGAAVFVQKRDHYVLYQEVDVCDVTPLDVA